MKKKIILVALFTLFCNTTISAKSIWKKTKDAFSSKQTAQVFSDIGSLGVGSSTVAIYIDKAHDKKESADKKMWVNGESPAMQYKDAIIYYIRALQAMDIYGRPAGQPSRSDIWDHIAQCLKSQFFKKPLNDLQASFMRSAIHSDDGIAGATASSRINLMNKEANAMCKKYQFKCKTYFA